MIWLIAGIGFSLVFFVYYFFVKPLSYWRQFGVQQDSFGSVIKFNWGTFSAKRPFVHWVQMVYESLPNVRYLGTYQLNTPILLIRDPDLIKSIAVKDFDHFTDHRQFLSEDADLLWSNNLLALRGQRWKDARATLSPCFTSTKMKHMFNLIEETSKNFINYFKNLNEDREEIDLELKDTFSRFANDVIATTAFGVSVDSLKEKDNHFYEMGKKLTDLMKPKGIARFFMFSVFPNLARWLKLSLFDEDVKNFFIELTKDIIKVRKEKKIVRPDLIHLLMEAQKGKLKHEDKPEVTVDTGFATANESEIGKNCPLVNKTLTDMDIAAQAMSFFFAGFDTVSSLMCFMGYELAVNPEIQEKLRLEVKESLKKGPLSYESVLRLKYLDMVVTEVLRKWPINAAVDRLSTRPYTIPASKPGEKDIHLPTGTIVWLPVYPLHHDPEYYPNPEKFDPERFIEENKSKIQAYTYLPFGAGPRNCMGSRLALLEAKTIFCHILNNFEIVPSAKSVIPLQLSKKQFVMNCEEGFWFKFKKLNQ